MMNVYLAFFGPRTTETIPKHDLSGTASLDCRPSQTPHRPTPTDWVRSPRQVVSGNDSHRTPSWPHQTVFSETGISCSVSLQRQPA